MLDPASPMVAKPMLDGVANLISLCLLLGDVYVAKTSPVSKLFATMFSCISLSGSRDRALELAMWCVLVIVAQCLSSACSVGSATFGNARSSTRSSAVRPTSAANARGQC